MTYNWGNAQANNQTGNSTTVQYIGQTMKYEDNTKTIVASNDFVGCIKGAHYQNHLTIQIRKKNSDGTYGDGAGNSGTTDFIFSQVGVLNSWTVDGVDYKTQAQTGGSNGGGTYWASAWSLGLSDDGAGNVTFVTSTRRTSNPGDTVSSADYGSGGFWPLQWNGTSFVKRPLIMNDGDASGNFAMGDSIVINGKGDVIMGNHSSRGNTPKLLQFKGIPVGGTGKGIWTKSTGTLALRVEYAITANETLNFNVNLTNGDISRNPVVPTVEVNGANSASATAMSTGILGFNWPRPQVGVECVHAISAGSNYLFSSIDKNGNLNTWGKLGHGVVYSNNQPYDFHPPTGKKYREVHPNPGEDGASMCAIDMEGGLYCWGSQKMGDDIGVEWHNDTDNSHAGATRKGYDVSGNLKSGVKSLVGAGAYWLALKDNGNVYGWGRVGMRSGAKAGSIYDLSGGGTFSYTNVKDIYTSTFGMRGGLMCFVKNDNVAHFFGSENQSMAHATISGVKTTDGSVTTISEVKKIYPTEKGMWVLKNDGTVHYKGATAYTSIGGYRSVTIREMFWNTSHVDFVKATHITTCYAQDSGEGKRALAYIWREDGTILSNGENFATNKTIFPFMSDKTHSTFKKMKDLFVFKDMTVVAVDEDNTAYASKAANTNLYRTTVDWYLSNDTDHWTRDCSNQNVSPPVNYRIYPNIKDVCMPLGGAEGNSSGSQAPINMIDTDGNLFGCDSAESLESSRVGCTFWFLDACR